MNNAGIQPCAWCGEGFTQGEAIEPGGVHYECGLRSAIGSVGHQRRRCSCYGGEDEDPPGLTRREAAVAAALFFHFGRGPAKK